jgi:membrane fusion protein (multidrug efflux system)
MRSALDNAKEAHPKELAVFAKPMTALCTMVCALCLLLSIACEQKEEKPKPTPPEVLFTEVSQQNVPQTQEYVALLTGQVNADITPKVQGYLLRQNYTNGYFVKKGQLMFELDPRQYQAALDEAKSQVAVAEANLSRVDADVARDTPLAAQNAIPQKQLDNDLANQKALQAAVLAAKAAQQNAELNLAWTKVYSPIDGIAGTASSQIGDLVGTATKMVTVSTVDPIWANFNVSEARFLSFAPKVTGFISGRTNVASLKNIVEYIQANDEPYPIKGSIIAINRAVGTSTGTIQITAEFPNTSALLRPGGFGRVRISTGVDQNALLVPQPAVVEVQTDFQVVVLTPDGKATFRPVKVGERVGPNWIVTEGLKPGERVVVEGIQKVQMFAAGAPELMKTGGVPVIAKPWVAPTTQAAAGSN